MVIQIYGTPNDNQAIRDLKKGDINDALSFEYEPFFCGVGTFTLELPLTTPFATELVENNLLYIKEDDTGLIIKNVKRNNDKITVVGYDLNGMLLDRITMERDTGVEGAEGKDCISGSTETCVKHFVEYNMISSPDIFRNYPRLAVAEDLGRGIANDSDLVGKECLEDVVRTLCEGAGLGYRIKLVMSESQTEPLLIFDVYEREDHTADQSERNRVIFSEGMGNLTQIERETGITAEKNAVWCDTGGENMFVYKTDEDGEPFNPVSWNRREEYISLSVTDSYDTEEIELTARKQMADKYAQTDSLTIEAGNPLDYGTVYKLGDIVTVYDKKRSLQLNSVISSVLIKRSGEEHSVQITLGERKPKLLDKYVKQNQLQRKAQTDFPPTAGNSTSGTGLLASYEYVSDNSIKYNGMTYTVSKDGTGLITKISDSEGAEFSPEISGTITDVTFHNAVLTAVALLCGLTPVTKPVINVSFDGTLMNTGSDQSVEVSYKGETPVYATGTDGAKCWSATTFTQVYLSNCAKYLDKDFTICLRFKINDNGLTPYYGLRRLLWFNRPNNYYAGIEVGYTGAVTTSAVTTNKINFEIMGASGYSGSINRADGNWHTAVLRRTDNTGSLMVDDELITGPYQINNPGEFIRLSGTNQIPYSDTGTIPEPAITEAEGFTLNGYIQDLKVYDTALSDREVALAFSSNSK